MKRSELKSLVKDALNEATFGQEYSQEQMYQAALERELALFKQRKNITQSIDGLKSIIGRFK